MGKPIADKKEMGSNRHRRFLTWVFGILAAALLLPLVVEPVLEIPAVQAAFVDHTNQRSNFWRAVREGRSGYSAVPGDERGVLIQNGGEIWREVRNGWVAWYTPWLPAMVLAAITAFFLYRGRIRVEKPRSGREVLRWSAVERFVHWYTAILFLILAVTGLSLLFGRAVLIPVMGREEFGTYAQFAKDLHNYTGPLFSLGVLAMIVLWIGDNFPDRLDLEWLKKGGGMGRNGEHIPTGRMNAGEKIWFWFITLFGGAVIASGYVLDFPNFGQDRSAMQIANVIHAVLAMAWLALALAHIYIGTLGTEGAFEGMATGKVSEEWAEQHHDLWLEEIRRREQDQTASQARPSGSEV